VQHERLYKRGGIYYARIPQPSGPPKRVSTKCTDRRAAEAAYVLLEREAYGTPDIAPDTPTPHSVDDAVSYLVKHGILECSVGTIKMYRAKGGHIGRLLGALDVNALHIDHVRKYAVDRLAEGSARESVRKELVTLRRTLELAHERGLLRNDVASIMPKFRAKYVPRKTFLTLDQFRALVAVLRPGRLLWVIVAVYTGGRESEVDGLEWTDIDWARRRVWLAGTKTAGSRRWVPLTALLSDVLSRVRMAKGPVVGEWLNVRRDLAAACRRAQIPKVTPNDLRRTYASWMKQDGVDSAVVAKLLGHTSTKMVDLVYGQLDDATFDRAAASMPGGVSVVCSPVASEMGSAVRSEPSGAEPFEAVSVVKSVLGDGVEPPTRGFSVRKSSPPKLPELLEKSTLRAVKS